MKTYIIEAIETKTTFYQIEVKAKNEEEAREKAFDGEGKIILEKEKDIETQVESITEKE